QKSVSRHPSERPRVRLTVSWKRWKAQIVGGSWAYSGTQSAQKCIRTRSPCSGRSLKCASSGVLDSSSSTKSQLDPEPILLGQAVLYPIMDSSPDAGG